MKRLLILLWLIVLKHTAYGQLKESLPELKQLNSIGKPLSVLSVYATGMDTLIREKYKDSQEYQVLFLGVKFTVTKEGNVANVLTSTNTPDFLTSLLKQNLEKTSGKWKPRRINGKPVDSDPIIITYHLSIEPTNAYEPENDDGYLGRLLLKSLADLPALRFPDEPHGNGVEDLKMHGTFYKPTIIRIAIFQKGWQK
ncbi:hypothetical protein QNI19_35545 [Cytophagaceae bacterium DM2B3-1]|uniref:TonB C-terminal domain-containing protein n=2 Tax=Xanthocytophaga flava TaxID=3048013 RepID=A0ABT7CX05_9BACT|nr:hypothetical protein [Xanthocytophaga flavus]